MVKIALLGIASALLCIGVIAVTATSHSTGLPLEPLDPVLITVVGSNLKVNFTNLGKDSHINPSDINEYLRGFGMRALTGKEMQILSTKLQHVNEGSIIHNFNIVGEGYMGRRLEIAYFPFINQYGNFTAVTLEELVHLDIGSTLFAVTQLQ